MRRLIVLAALNLLAAACASASPEAPATPAAQAQSATPQANGELAIYEGTYALEAPNRTINLRVWVGSDGKLMGELVGMGQQTTFRPAGNHKFLHGTMDDAWVVFTVEDGRAVSATMHQRGREITGPRSQ